MNDDAKALPQHCRKKTAVQTHRRKKIELEFLLPGLIGQRQNAAARRGRTADAVDQDIQAAEPLEGCLDDMIRSRARTDIRLDELRSVAVSGNGSRRGQHRPSASEQTFHNRLANSFGAARNEDSLAGEFVSVGCRVHPSICWVICHAATGSKPGHGPTNTLPLFSMTTLPSQYR